MDGSHDKWPGGCIRDQGRGTVRWSSAIAFVALCSAASAQYGPPTLQIIPPSPRYQEPVYARFNWGWRGHCVYGAEVSMSGNVITIADEYIIDICWYPYDVQLGRFPTGTYTVRLGDLSAQFTVGSRMPNSGYPGTVPAVDYSGLWWNPLESGWGLSISQGPANAILAIWHVYDAAGMPTWYTIESGEWTHSHFRSGYSGSVYRYTGPHFANAFDPGKVAGTSVGTAELTFHDASRGRLDYTIDGVGGSHAIERLPIE